MKATGLDDETVVRKAYERYNGKTDFEANSREANENMLLDMYLSVISNPMNFAEARQPLDTVTDYLKDKILKDVDKLTGQGKRTSKSQLYFSTPAFQSRTKAELNGGKFGIGPFALANAHQVLTQLVKLNFKPNKVLSDYGIRDLHHIQSEDTNKINVLDWLSALINAHVDVAKDPYIIRLNVRKLTFNMTNFLIRSGKGESTFYFLPQQILKDYATEYDKYSGFYGVEIPAGKNPERLAFTKIWNDYYKKAKELSGGKKENLLNYLKDKGVGTNQRKTMFTVPHLRKQLQKTETFDWYYNQLLILKAYEELTPFSKSLSELTNLSQIDTKRFGNNFGLQSAFLDKWKQYMTEQAVFDNPLKVFTNTFLGKKMIDGLVFPRNAFQNVMIRLTPEFETLRSLIEYYTKGYAISDDTYINNITRAMEVSYKTKFFNQYVKDNQMGFRGMLFGKDSISRRLDRLKSDILQGKYPSLLGSDGSFSNVLINNIFSRPKEDDAELQGPDFIAYKPNKSGDNNLENEIIRAWEELYESDYKEVREFAKDLAIYSFYTSGDAFGKNNIFRYVPNSIREEIGYFDYIRELEKHPENVISQIDLQEVIRNLWWNDHVVPAIEYYKLDSSYETIEEEGRAVYRPVAHDDSGLFVTNKKGEQVEIPSIIYDESSKFRGIVGYNEAGNPIHYLYKKVKLDKNNDPRTTFLYKYIGIDENKVPVYQLINKKGLSYKGNVLVEFGFKKSSVGYNNVVPTGLDFTPSKAITYVQDLTPVKASLQTKIFNQAGEFNENALQTVATENVDLQNTEPLAYQEWSKTYQSRNGEAASQEAYQQYLDNNEAWQIEYELAPDQSVPAKFKGNMTFDYGENGRSELKSKSTLEAIKNGERTATTRYESQGHLDYWKQAQVGDVIEWKRGDESVKVLVTKPLTKLRTSDAIQQNLFADERPSETINMEVKPSETSTQFTELQQYANQVGLTEVLPKVEEVKQAVEETKQIQDKYVYTFDDGLEVKLDFELNDQQKSALKELEAFVNGDDTSITLSGYAGTGKTTIMGIFNEYLKRRIQADIIFSAPTHRANAVTRQKTPNAKVITLQSLLGLRPDFDITEDVFDLHKLKFEQVADVKIEAASIVIVDEASMIQDSLYDFLLEQIAAKGAQIIFMGDKGQLRPVKANNISKVFRNDGAQLQLTKVERTGDNPILKESTRVRNGEGFSYETDIAPNGQGVEYSSDKTRIREFVRTSLKEMKDSQDPLYFRVLAATNSSVEAYNSAIRQILYGRRPAQLYEGELVMGYSNREYDSLRKKYKLMNSGDYVVQSVKPTTIQIDLTYPDRKESISMEGYKVTLKDAIDTSASSFTIDVVSNFETDENIIKVQEYIQTLWSMRNQLLAEGNPTAARSVIEKINNIQNRIHTMRDIKDANGRLKLRKSFDYGYAHTIHKSQGGTYSKVLINDSSINTFGFNDKNGQEVRQELKYVAVSRAKNYVMVQTLEKAKQQVVEDYDLDEEFVSATAADLKQAANDSATEELDKMGKQRKKECE